MIPNLIENIKICRNIVESVSQLLYYSHLPTAGLALFVAIFIYIKNRRLILAQILLLISFCFSFWSLLDLLIWFNYDNSSVLMFAWAPIEIFSVLLFILLLYFLHTFIYEKDFSLGTKILLALMFLPVAIFSYTDFNLIGYDAQECIAVENTLLANYVLFLKIFFSAWMIALVAKASLLKHTFAQKKLAILSVGIFSFIFAFLISGIIAGITGNYILEIYGLMAMIVFIVAIARLVVLYGEFNIKMFSAQILVIGLVVLIIAQFTFIRNQTNLLLNSITLIASLFFGWHLINSVKKENQQQEEIAKLVTDLQKSNTRQSELIRFVTHQVKGFFTKSRNIFATLLDGDYGTVLDSMRPLMEEGLRSDERGVDAVQQILNAANISKGTVNYDKKEFDFKTLVIAEFDKLKSIANSKGLKFGLYMDDADFNVVGDKNQLAHTVRNIIDNAIKYTPKGSVSVYLKKRGDTVIFQTKDTGVGINDKDKERLFTEGGRGIDSVKINVDSTGFGLFIAKNIVGAHNGKITAESEGESKGSTFTVEIPRAKS